MHARQRRQPLHRFARPASQCGHVAGARHLAERFEQRARIAPWRGPATVSAIRSAEAMLIAQPRASKPTSAMRIGVAA